MCRFTTVTSHWYQVVDQKNFQLPPSHAIKVSTLHVALTVAGQDAAPGVKDAVIVQDLFGDRKKTGPFSIKFLNTNPKTEHV